MKQAENFVFARPPNKKEKENRMNLIDYQISVRLSRADIPFDALIAAAMRKADSTNSAKLESAFPETYQKLFERYNAPGGIIPTDAFEEQDLEKILDRCQNIASSYIKKIK